MPTIKLRSGKYMVPVEVTADGPYLYLAFPYSVTLKDEVKAMEGSHWCGFDDPPRKVWRVDNSVRNKFQFEYLMGLNPYERFDSPLKDVTPRRAIYAHQRELLAYGITRKESIWAAEMGTGKTLSAIELMEHVGGKAWYIGPRAGVRAVTRELYKWEAQVMPEMLTYEGLVRRVTKGISEDDCPQVVIFDESSKVKTPTSQRSKAAYILANLVRKVWGKDAYIILMTGTPAPKSPLDWWFQCEIACPGFLREGSLQAFHRTLAITEQRDNPITGGAYPVLLSWRDSEDKCNKCGKPKDAPVHAVATAAIFEENETHEYVPAVNEVARLYHRMSGLVAVKFKRDCLDLPEKTYEILVAPPTTEMLLAARMIRRVTPKAITAITLLRELSDGFQYTQVEDGVNTCPLCNGDKTIMLPAPTIEGEDTSIKAEVGDNEYKQEKQDCPNCGGTGVVKRYVDKTELLPTPKDDILAEQLDEHEDVGRLIVWSGFTGSIDKIVTICLKADWIVLRVDGRGSVPFTRQGVETPPVAELFDAMDASHKDRQSLLEKYPRVVFVGHPKAGGMSYTLTASPTELFYSNDFSGEARMQAEDRFHRAGMDTNRGAVIRDIFCLPTDKLVLDNLKQKRRLQDISLGEIDAALNEKIEERVL